MAFANRPPRCVITSYSIHYTKLYDDYQNYPSNAAIYLPGGKPPEVGARFVQSDLGRTLSYMVEEERRAAAKGGRMAGLAAEVLAVGEYHRRLLVAIDAHLDLLVVVV